MLKVFIAVLLIAATPKVYSQNNNELYQPKLLLRFNVLGLADPLDQNLSLGFEQRFHPNWSAGTDAAWIFASQYVQQAKGANGLIARPFIRCYPNENGIGFFEMELHYKYVRYKLEDWLGREPVNGVATYEEYTTFNLHKHVLGVHFKAGLAATISRNEKLKFEFTGGLGLRHKWQSVTDGVYANLQTGTFNNTMSNFSPALPVTMRLTYLIK